MRAIRTPWRAWAACPSSISAAIRLCVLDGDGNASEIIDIGAFEVGPSDNLAPKVADVLLNGVQTGTTSTDWVNMISFAELVPLGKQLAPIYRDGTNRIQIVFSEDVRRSDGSMLDGSELTLLGTGQANSGGPTVVSQVPGTFGYDSETHVATWTFPTLAPDRYRIDLEPSEVRNIGGNALDGHWDNQFNSTFYDWTDDPAGRTFLSGNGGSGTPFQIMFALLPGRLRSKWSS